MSADINESIKAFTPIVAILVLGIVAVEAFNHGLNGAVWVATTGTIALLAGVRGKDLVERLRSTS